MTCAALGRLVASAACGHRPPPRGDCLTDTRAMPDKRIAVYLETTDKKVFACAQDWPGWCRAGKDEELALAGAGRRRAALREGREAGRASVPDGDAATDFEVVERGRRRRRHGVRRPERDARRPTGGPSMPREAERLAALVEASWTIFDRDPRAVTRVAPEGSARRRPRPRQDDRPRHGRRLARTPEPARAQAPGAGHR